MTDLFLDTKKQIESLGFNIIGHDFNRPRGGFLLIDESQSKEFISKFISNKDLKIKNKVSPKILIVKPESRLSWQYHCRRKEIWRVYKNSVGIIRSMDNNQNEMEILREGDIIKFQTEERHRLIGLSNFANDYGDGILGTDDNRIGPKRSIASGEILPSELKKAVLINIFISVSLSYFLIKYSFGTNYYLFNGFLIDLE